MSMDPQMMFNIGMGLNIASGMFGAYGQYQQGAMTQDYYDFLARQIERQGQLDAESVREYVRGVAASQRAAMAASGVSGDSVTAQDILDDTAKKGALDELMILHNAQVEALNARYQGRMGRAAGMMGAATTLLGTAGQVSDRWEQWKRTGAGGERKRVPKLPKGSLKMDGPLPGTKRKYTGWA